MKNKTLQPNNTYTALNEAYSFFNKKLFNNELPACLITMQRKKNSLGYFAGGRFENKTNETDIVHEIALNPKLFRGRTDKEILSTLVHEMAHLWQHENGTPSRSGYHNKQWAVRMEELGLMPSHNGTQLGKKTGQSMTHYVIEGGHFETIVKIITEEGAPILYQDRPEGENAKKKAKSKVKYTCNVCGLNAWAKPNVQLVCYVDNTLLMAEEQEDEEEDE